MRKTIPSLLFALMAMLCLPSTMLADDNYYCLRVIVDNTKGEIEPDIAVKVQGSSYSNSATTDANGIVTFQLLPGDYSITAFDVTTTASIVDADVNTSLTVPAIITFNIVGLQESLYGRYYYSAYNTLRFKPTTKDYRYNGEDITVDLDNTDGCVAKGRLYPEQAYYIKNFHGTTYVSEGCTITLGTVKVVSEGMGFAFPMESFEPVSLFDVIVSSPFRLTAIPVSDDKFVKWEINGKDYFDPIIDYKTADIVVTAKAVFSGNSSAVMRPIQINSGLDFNDSYITLPAEMEGTARIFTIDGKQVRQMGVIGDQIGIYDLPLGAYVLSFQHNDGVINAHFLKK